MTGARRLPNGLLRPWVCDWWDGVQEVERLKAQGLDVRMTGDELASLGQALDDQQWIDYHGPVYAHEPELSPEASRIVDRLVAEWQTTPHPTPTHPHGQALDLVLDQAQDGAPASPRITPDIHGNGDGRAPRDGHPRRRRHERWTDRVRNEGIDPITAYLEQDQDDDHDWRPA